MSYFSPYASNFHGYGDSSYTYDYEENDDLDCSCNLLAPFRKNNFLKVKKIDS